MKILTLEERIQRLEKLLCRHTSLKNELLELGEPKRADEPRFIKKLFDKYPTIKKALSYKDHPTKNTNNEPFHLVLSSNDSYNNISFIIQGLDRNNMQCTAFDDNDSKIDTLKPFNIDADINTVARFILELLQSNKNQRYEKKIRKVESVSLSGMDCESIRKYIEDSLSKKYDANVEVEADKKYANLGIVVISIYNPDFVAEYTITADDTDSFKVDCNGNTVVSAYTINDTEDRIVNHFLDNYNK